MSNCSACFPTEINYQIKLQEVKFLDIIIDHFSRNSLRIHSDQNTLHIRESLIQDFYDFARDHMDLSQLSFRIADEEWRPITDIEKVLEVQWIDSIIVNKQISCHIQPIVTKTRSIYGYEILSRFTTVEGQPKSPFEVFSAAKERNRLYALDKLCRMNAVQHAPFFEGKAFINFIPTSIYSPEHCLKSTVELATKLNVDPSRFVFEVVESEKVDDLEHLKRILKYYKQKGFQYALDDVGEGFSTVEVLNEIQPQYMKLDRKYVDGVSLDGEKQKMAKKLLNAAMLVGATPLAEGIEEKEDFECLKDMGYELFQGYLFGKPAPVENGETQFAGANK